MTKIKGITKEDYFRQYRESNKKRIRELLRIYNHSDNKKCNDCSNLICNNSTRCKPCSNIHRKGNYIYKYTQSNYPIGFAHLKINNPNKFNAILQSNAKYCCPTIFREMIRR